MKLTKNIVKNLQSRKDYCLQSISPTELHALEVSDGQEYNNQKYNHVYFEQATQLKSKSSPEFRSCMQPMVVRPKDKIWYYVDFSNRHVLHGGMKPAIVRNAVAEKHDRLKIVKRQMFCHRGLLHREPSIFIDLEPSNVGLLPSDIHIILEKSKKNKPFYNEDIGDMPLDLDARVYITYAYYGVLWRKIEYRIIDYQSGMRTKKISSDHVEPLVNQLHHSRLYRRIYF